MIQSCLLMLINITVDEKNYHVILITKTNLNTYNTIFYNTNSNTYNTISESYNLECGVQVDGYSANMVCSVQWLFFLIDKLAINSKKDIINTNVCIPIWYIWRFKNDLLFGTDRLKKCDIFIRLKSSLLFDILIEIGKCVFKLG